MSETFRFNPQQQAALEALDGPLLLLAGAGTGKTRVIVQRIVNMIRRGTSADSILALTFTNKAAREMRERVEKALTPPQHAPMLCTFHSFCATLLRRHASILGYTNNFTLATEGYQTGLLREIAVECGLANSGVDPYLWLSLISRAKSSITGYEEMQDEKVARIYRRYDERLKQMNMMDFDDMLLNTIAIWEKSPDLLQWYQERYQYLMVDEYQDTNRVQLEILKLLAGTRHNVCVVGDDDQSIYGWRGADQRNILEFEESFPEAKTIRLEQNYRSTNNILKAANGLIAKNHGRHEKNLWSANGDGEIPVAIRCEDGIAEADFIADRIYTEAGEKGQSVFSRQRNWRKFAVLYRTGGQSRLFEEALRKRHIPYEIVGSKSFYQRKEILDLLSMLELAVNPKNDMSLLRVINVPPRGAGDALLRHLQEKHDITHLPLMELLVHESFTTQIPRETQRNLAAFHEAILRCADDIDKKGPVAPRVERLIADIQYLDKLIQMYKPRSDALERRENVLEFLNALRDYDEAHQNASTLEEFLEMIALQDAGDRREKDKDVTENAVSLMTIHAAKGLEFPVVFIVGLEQGLFPHQMAMDEGNLEEERRLCYVALTRAKQKLYLTYVEKRRSQGQMTVRRPSIFLDEIPPEFLQFKNPKQINEPISKEEASDAFAEMIKRLQANKKE